MFAAPDGLHYSSVWGEMEIVMGEQKAFTPSPTNRFVQIVGKKRTLFMKEDHILAVMECDETPIKSEQKGVYSTDIAKTYFI